MRLNRYLSQAGIASRRKADDLIKAGQVKINGKVSREMGQRVKPGDRVEVNGQRVTPHENVYLLLNKPKDTITTTSDERDRKTVMDLLDLSEEEKKSLFPVGRLDRHTLGVLLVTNDGELANRLMHPRYEVDKFYQIQTADPVRPDQLDQLMIGVELEDGPAKAEQAAYVALPSHHVIGMKLHEGRNRQIRRMMEALGHTVVQLERVRYAGLTTAGVRRGKWRKLTEREVKQLRRLVKLKG